MLFYVRVFAFMLFTVSQLLSIYIYFDDPKYFFKLTRLHHFCTICVITLFLIKIKKLEKIHQLLYSLSLPVGLIISLVYWPLLFKYQTPLKFFLSFVSHAVVQMYSVAELCLNKMKVHNHAPLFGLLFILIYLFWTHIYHFIYKDFVYSPMKKPPTSYVFYILTPFLVFVATIGNKHLHKVRDNLRIKI